MSSGVKNLRAMFEQKGDASVSPPDRGRSPGIPPSFPAASSDSPRPLSKVRTSFIAIEKDGRIGLQRETSQDSVFSVARKLSGDSQTATPSAGIEKPNPFEEAMSKPQAKTSLKDQPIPESPKTDLTSSSALIKNAQDPKLSSASTAAATQNRKSSQNGDGAPDVGPSASSNGATSATAQRVQNGTNGRDTKDRTTSRETSNTTVKTATKTTTRPAAISSTAKTATKAAKSPTVSTGPKSPAQPSTPKLPANTPERASRQLDKTMTPKAATSTFSPPRASSAKRPPPLQQSPASTGFVKPKPKSPTRPIKLPAGLTTHTAASGSKLNVPRQTLSRASGSGPLTQSVESLGRSPSRVSASTTTASTAKVGVTKGLKSQSSTINRPRPSVGPPPKQAAKEYPPTRKEKEVDPSFLDRMMRPTRASSSKTAEKVVTTPPRKPSGAPAGRQQTARTETKPIRMVRPVGGPVFPAGRLQGAGRDPAGVKSDEAAPIEEKAETTKTAEGKPAASPTASHHSGDEEAAEVEAPVSPTASHHSGDEEGAEAKPAASPTASHHSAVREKAVGAVDLSETSQPKKSGEDTLSDHINPSVHKKQLKPENSTSFWPEMDKSLSNDNKDDKAEHEKPDFKSDDDILDFNGVSDRSADSDSEAKDLTEPKTAVAETTVTAAC